MKAATNLGKISDFTGSLTISDSGIFVDVQISPSLTFRLNSYVSHSGGTLMVTESGYITAGVITDSCMIKYDNDLKLVWAIRTTDENSAIFSIEVDKSGNSYFTGQSPILTKYYSFSNITAGEIILESEGVISSSPGPTNIGFTISYTPEGKMRWFVPVANDATTVITHDSIISTKGNLYTLSIVTSYPIGTTYIYSFDSSGVGVINHEVEGNYFNSLGLTPNESWIVSKYNSSNGKLIWASYIIGSLSDAGHTSINSKYLLVDDSENIYFSGKYDTPSTAVFSFVSKSGGNITFLEEGYLPTVPVGIESSFVAKFDKEGSFSWVSTVESQSTIPAGLKISPDQKDLYFFLNTSDLSAYTYSIINTLSVGGGNIITEKVATANAEADDASVVVKLSTFLVKKNGKYYLKHPTRNSKVVVGFKGEYVITTKGFLRYEGNIIKTVIGQEGSMITLFPVIPNCGGEEDGYWGVASFTGEVEFVV